MREAIEWLIHMEDESGQIYDEAAKLFDDDIEFCKLLKGLAKDENQHHKLLLKAQQHFENSPDISLEPAYLSLDDKTKRKIKKPLIDFIRALHKGTISRDEALEHIVKIEYSEWNDLFAYILGAMKDTARDFVDVATHIQQHRRRIERFLEGNKELAWHLKKIKPLPTLWNEKILIIENSDVVANMLSTILNEEGSIDRVVDGDEALEKISHTFYAAIISNVDLPKRDGIELYKIALKKFPNIRHRFVFFTGNEEHISFFKKSGVKYLIKPTPIDKIRGAVISAIETS
ncbi:hypothetical protein MNBD_DELTA01-2119 [hydrothermal vent metagenome]|uniref:Response regulatory domain-containing protein n=1 Tax=hydrothermal vent metagenome TaxID=652676 RepID=A0A3B0R6Z2_9ZZZZ